MLLKKNLILILLSSLTLFSCGFRAKYQNAKIENNSDLIYITRIGIKGPDIPKKVLLKDLSDLKEGKQSSLDDDAILSIEISEKWEQGAITRDASIERISYVLTSVSTIILPSNQPFSKRHYVRGYYVPGNSAYANQLVERQLAEDMAKKLSADIRDWVYNHKYGIK